MDHLVSDQPCKAWHMMFAVPVGVQATRVTFLRFDALPACSVPVQCVGPLLYSPATRAPQSTSSRAAIDLAILLLIPAAPRINSSQELLMPVCAQLPRS